ncbi:MAG: hypothetical protein IT320_07100 [Anaerolineae bacterium]|nr:hypothetical protein [Anaerolineae bacterium]
MTDITIRPLRTFDEMPPAVDLQRTHWGDDLESVVPAQMLFTLATHGGHVLAAFDGARMVGLLIGLLGTGEDYDGGPVLSHLEIASKRMVVLNEYRSHGIGYRLKMAQRDFALQQGMKLVTWTFDPLLAPNASLNVHKLGAICRTYRVDYYGTDTGAGLTTLGSSDRLLAEWLIAHERVAARAAGTYTAPTLAQVLEDGALIVNPAIVGGGVWIAPGKVAGTRAATLLLEIPLNCTAMIDAQPDLARLWRRHTRPLFQDLFSAGYVATEFVRATYEGRDRAFYVLSRGESFEA